MAANAGDPFVPAFWRVRASKQELADTVTLELEPPAGVRPAFSPGQFNMLYAFGVGEAAISLSGDPAESGLFTHTVRNVGNVSAAICGLEPGAAIGVRGPFGVGWPVEEAEGSDVLIVAGGLGLAPLRPSIYRVLTERGRYGHASLLLGSRRPQEMLYAAQLEEWRRQGAIDVALTVDHAGPGWGGHVGVVPELIPKARFDPDATVAMVCGPEIMMRFSVRALTEAGVAPHRIWLSMERNMKCGIGLCGHCQFGPTFVCKDGPVMRYDRIADIFALREI